MHDEIAVCTACDGRDLYTRSAKCRACLVELELATRECARQHLQLRLFDGGMAVRERASRAGGGRRELWRSLLDHLARVADLFHGSRRGLNHHRLFELVLRLIVLDEAQLVMTYRDDIAVLQGMLLDELAVDVG